MFDRARLFLMRWLRVPPEPSAPLGAPGSVRVFRAGRNYYRLMLGRWGIRQAATLAGIVFSLSLLAVLKRDVDAHVAFQSKLAAERAAQAAAAAPATAELTPAGKPAAPQVTVPADKIIKRRKLTLRQQWEGVLEFVAERAPHWAIPAITLFELGGVAFYLLQIPLTYAMVRLEFESRWYIVTDRSLRIRSGLVSLQESTMSFANLQQVTVTQGPLQRLLGLADVRVQSAGGGGEQPGHSAHDSMHTGTFHSVDNAHQIRDLILDRLREFRAVGLGDPDDAHEKAAVELPPAASPPDETLTAARALLAEARALREACARDRQPG